MSEAIPPARPRRLVWLLPRLLVVLLLVGLCVGAVFFLWKRTHRPAEAVATQPTTDPRLTFQTPYRNVRPDVRYVGDSACVDCHTDVAEHYRHHPMARSLTPVGGKVGEKGDSPLKKGGQAPFSKTQKIEGMPIDFTVEEHDGRMIQRLRGREPGSTLTHEDEVRFLLGSGSRGQSALIDHDGLLFQSPISWFRPLHGWGLAPGYRDLHFDRVIRPACLYCHANRALPVVGTENRYTEPIFDGFGIGCERCHGPGQLHVERRERGEVVDGIDDTIVNPKHLPPALREAVCQQCHLVGSVRLPRAGREIYDYRPGLPLEDFWAIFLQPDELTDSSRAVGQVEQMYGSRCFRATKGKLGCISCHDPHEEPAPDKNVAYFRDRCLTCHAQHGCSMPVKERLRKSPADSCIQCHMPRFASGDVAHSATTNHRIPRRPDKHPAIKSGSRGLGTLLIDFYPNRRAASADRDLGVALMLGSRRGEFPPRQAAQQAEQLLFQLTPDDAAGHDARAWALWQVGRKQDALREAEQALQIRPNDETLLRTAAILSDGLGQTRQAMNYARRVLKMNPYDAEVHAQLAMHLARQGDWTDVETECRAALRSDPTHIEARRYLVLWLLENNRADEAKAEMKTILSLKPSNAADLSQWFDRQMEHWRRSRH